MRNFQNFVYKSRQTYQIENNSFNNKKERCDAFKRQGNKKTQKLERDTQNPAYKNKMPCSAYQLFLALPCIARTGRLYCTLTWAVSGWPRVQGLIYPKFKFAWEPWAWKPCALILNSGTRIYDALIRSPCNLNPLPINPSPNLHCNKCSFKT